MEKEKRRGFSGLLQRISHPVDLTVGTPWKVILQYAAPIMLSYLLQQIYVLTDSVICGQVLQAEEIAGVNDTFSLTFIFLQFAFGCTAGFSVITANCVGAKDARGTRQSLLAQMYLSTGISVALTVLSLCTLPYLLKWIHVTPENPQVYQAAYRYCFVIFIGIFAQMGYNFVCGILRAYGDSVTPLWFLVISTVLNVGLDLLFLIPFGMGPIGAAIATVAAQFLSFLGSLFYLFLRYPALRIQKEDFRLERKFLYMHLKNGLPLGFQFSILAIGIIVMQGAVVKFDLTESGRMVASAPAQNGYGAANKLINFLMSFFNGLGAAILGYNAQNFGKNRQDRVRCGTLQALLMMLMLSVFCLAIGGLLSLHGAYQYVFMSADKVSEASIRYGNTFLYVDLALYAILGFLIVTRSAVQGICQSGYVLGAGIAELIARIVICTVLPAAVNGGEVNASASAAAFVAVCLGDPGAWIAASAVLLIPFCGGILRSKKTEDHEITAKL